MNSKEKANYAIIEFVAKVLGVKIDGGVVQIDISMNYERFPHLIIKTINPDQPMREIRLADGVCYTVPNFKTQSINLAPLENSDDRENSV